MKWEAWRKSIFNTKYIIYLVLCIRIYSYPISNSYVLCCSKMKWISKYVVVIIGSCNFKRDQCKLPILYWNKNILDYSVLAHWRIFVKWPQHLSDRICLDWLGMHFFHKCKCSGKLERWPHFTKVRIFHLLLILFLKKIGKSIISHDARIKVSIVYRWPPNVLGDLVLLK